MDNVIWKAFKISEIFKRVTPPSTNVPAKALNISDKQFDGSIALITRAETNNGIRGFIKKGNYPTLSNAITYNDQFSIFLYHKYEFTTIKDHLSVITGLNKTFQSLLDKNGFINSFLVILLNHLFSKDIFDYTFTGSDYKFDREIILLPCLEVSKDSDYIWEEDGHYYTLAVVYIEKLMKEAKELREQKTIRLYEAERAKYERERAKYERERAKYEVGYKKEKQVLLWKAFKLGDLFERDNSHQISSSKKKLDESKHYDENHTIKNITASKNNNGCSGYLKDEDETNKIKKKNYLTVASDAAYGGICFYQKDYFVSTGHNNLIIIKNDNLKNLLDKNIINYEFIAKMITKVLCNGVANRFFRSVSSDFDRELILLPCLEVAKDDEYIWEEDGHYYTLAVDYISYIYLSGRVEYNQKLIDKYEYKY